MNIFIDTQDMEERYGEQLYQEYLEEQNKNLKKELTNLKAIEKEHQRINGELQVRINKAIEVMNAMIHTGYILKNNDSATQFMATSKKSEFGTRAEVLINILKGSEQ